MLIDTIKEITFLKRVLHRMQTGSLTGKSLIVPFCVTEKGRCISASHPKGERKPESELPLQLINSLWGVSQCYK